MSILPRTYVPGAYNSGFNGLLNQLYRRQYDPYAAMGQAALAPINSYVDYLRKQDAADQQMQRQTLLQGNQARLTAERQTQLNLLQEAYKQQVQDEANRRAAAAYGLIFGAAQPQFQTTPGFTTDVPSGPYESAPVDSLSYWRPKSGIQTYSTLGTGPTDLTATDTSSSPFGYPTMESPGPAEPDYRQWQVPSASFGTPGTGMTAVGRADVIEQPTLTGATGGDTGLGTVSVPDQTTQTREAAPNLLEALRRLPPAQAGLALANISPAERDTFLRMPSAEDLAIQRADKLGQLLNFGRELVNSGQDPAQVSATVKGLSGGRLSLDFTKPPSVLTAEANAQLEQGKLSTFLGLTRDQQGRALYPNAFKPETPPLKPGEMAPSPDQARAQLARIQANPAAAATDPLVVAYGGPIAAAKAFQDIINQDEAAKIRVGGAVAKATTIGRGEGRLAAAPTDKDLDTYVDSKTGGAVPPGRYATLGDAYAASMSGEITKVDRKDHDRVFYASVVAPDLIRALDSARNILTVTGSSDVSPGTTLPQYMELLKQRGELALARQLNTDVQNIAQVQKHSISLYRLFGGTGRPSDVQIKKIDDMLWNTGDSLASLQSKGDMLASALEKSIVQRYPSLQTGLETFVSKWQDTSDQIKSITGGQQPQPGSLNWLTGGGGTPGSMVTINGERVQVLRRNPDGSLDIYNPRTNARGRALPR